MKLLILTLWGVLLVGTVQAKDEKKKVLIKSYDDCVAEEPVKNPTPVPRPVPSPIKK